MCKQLLSSAPPCSAADRQLPLLSLLQPLNNCRYITVASSARSIRHSNAQMGRFQVSQGPITRNTYPVVYLEIRTDLEPPDTSPSVKGTGNRCRQGTRSRRGVTTFRKTTRRCWQAVEEVDPNFNRRAFAIALRMRLGPRPYRSRAWCLESARRV